MRAAGGSLCVLALSLSACTQISDRVILLPGPDGRTGALSVTAAAGEVVLSEPYTGVDVTDSRLTRQKTSPGMVRDAYGQLLAMQPFRPRIFVVHFNPGKDALRPDSQAMLANIVATLANFPAGEAIVIGHTDRMGRAADNLRLSLRRAAAVRELLVGAGVAREAISVVGRGEHEPAAITDDEVAEALNRRVEIKLR